MWHLQVFKCWHQIQVAFSKLYILPTPLPKLSREFWPIYPFVMQRTLERIIDLEDPSLEGSQGKKEVRFSGLYFGGREEEQRVGKDGHRKQTSFNTVVLGWPGPLHFKAALSKNRLWQAKAICSRINFITLLNILTGFRLNPVILTSMLHSANLTF